MSESETYSGFIALAGRPNAGKSTFVNAAVGEKVAIVSDKPQTTRREIRGVLTRGNRQLVLIDLPGVQRPRDALTSRMQNRVELTLKDCDGVLFMLNGDQKFGNGDRFIAAALASTNVPVISVVNKLDLLSRAQVLDALQAAADFGLGEVYPLSALTGEGLDQLVDDLFALLPPGPFYYDPAEHTDMSKPVRLAELVREQILLRTRQEIPHSIEVEIDEITYEPELITVRANLWVETHSQKRILIGSGGRTVKAVGTASRPAVEELLGGHVFMDLKVAVKEHWRRDGALLDRLGIE